MNTNCEYYLWIFIPIEYTLFPVNTRYEYSRGMNIPKSCEYTSVNIQGHWIRPNSSEYYVWIFKGNEYDQIVVNITCEYSRALNIMWSWTTRPSTSGWRAMLHVLVYGCTSTRRVLGPFYLMNKCIVVSRLVGCALACCLSVSYNIVRTDVRTASSWTKYERLYIRL